MTNHIWNAIHRFLVSDDGPTAVEYAVMLSVIMAVLIGVAAVGTNTETLFQDSADKMP